jgi:hypothetical protein
MLQNAGAIRDDGTDKFFGLENVSFPDYCDQIIVD